MTDLLEIRISEKDFEEPMFQPRDAERRTLKQWFVFILYKIGFYKSYNYSYACPVCGDYPHDDFPSSTMLYISKPIYNSYYSYEFGVTGYDWEEEHQCHQCGTVYGFSNSSC